MSAVRALAPIELLTSQQHFDLLHATNPHGVAILWERQGVAKRWHKLNPGDPQIPRLLQAQEGTRDSFITVNEFARWRQVDNLRSLRALYVDIDRYLSLDDVCDALADAKLPNPSLIVWSGRGVHLYWLHAPMPANALPVWQRCQDVIVKVLASVGADPVAKDCARVLRLVGSLNAKNDQLVKGWVLDPEPWDWHCICDEVLGPRKLWTPKKSNVVGVAPAKADCGGRVHTGSIYKWWHLVYRDLISIAEHHHRIPEGSRNNYLFLSAVALSWFAHPETLQAELEQRAKTWTPDLSTSEVKSALKFPLERAALAATGVKIGWTSAEYGSETKTERDPRVWLKRQTIHAMMAPLINAELAPKLRAIVSDEVRTDRRRERDANRDRVAEGRFKTRQEDSVSRQKPWECLGISRRTYYRERQRQMSR